ncbi:hypothetical protein BC008_09565 [Mastigocoleus testarum BC008]|uniref:Uncharacterized protein n=1 Tax=Mastigocoleus testarum BC008 TaxID=371196 RepID=A0A0V7ZD01_9CYAN|nr:hypothetical protein BC008_09565 [Mastigocoleus testarum BC008]
MRKHKNKLAKIVTSAIFLLTIKINGLPSYALNEYSVAEGPKELETQTNEITIKKRNRNNLNNRRRGRKIRSNRAKKTRTTKVSNPQERADDYEVSCGRWVWHRIQKKWVYIKAPCR